MNPSSTNLRRPQLLAHIVVAGAGEPFVLVEFDAARWPVTDSAVAYAQDGQLASLSWQRADGVVEVVDLSDAVDVSLMAAAVEDDNGLLVVQVRELALVEAPVAHGHSFSVRSEASVEASAPVPGRGAP